jgi:predicted ATPase
MDSGNSAGDEQKITAVEVAGFKSAIAPVRVNLRDITVLAGANSTGKSTIMQPLLLIKQTMEKPFDPGGLAIDGPLVKFTHADQYLSHVRFKVVNQTFSVMVGQSRRQIRLWYGRSESGGIDVTKMTFRDGDRGHTWVNDQHLNRDDASFLDAFGREAINTLLFSGISDRVEIRVERNRGVLVAGLIEHISPILQISQGPIVSPAGEIANHIQSLIYLPGLRGNPERHYVVSSSGPHFPGSFNDYVASVIHRWGTSKDDRIGLLENNLRLLGLTSGVATEAIDDTRVELRVDRLPVAAKGGARDTVNIADVGFGVSQALPVLVSFLTANRGQIVFIEQPELHLHPRAQVALANIILQAADRGVRVVIETHSSLLILALQGLIAEGRIAPDRVSMNWFTRDNTGQTHVAEAALEKDGSYGDWPVDFDDVEADLQNRYLNLVDRLRAEG